MKYISDALFTLGFLRSIGLLYINIRDIEWKIFTLLGNQFAGILKGIPKTDGSLQQFLEY